MRPNEGVNDPRQAQLELLKTETPSRIVMVVVDGLGGLAHPDFGGKSELEHADLPNLDALVSRRDCVTGLQDPIARGFVPGSAAGHLALFGYDPLLPEHRIGRGIFEALDLKLPAGPNDVVARLNFATIGEDGVVVDRRARRIAESGALAKLLNERLSVPSATVEIIPRLEHRGVLVIRAEGAALSHRIADTDPLRDGLPLRRCVPIDGDDPSAAETARIAQAVSDQARDILRSSFPANGVLLRGFSPMRTRLPSLEERHGLKAVAVADYPLYRGVASLVGMEIAPVEPDLRERVRMVREYCDEGRHTFIFLHFKAPDARGEDADFLGKAAALEEFDAVVPDLLEGIDDRRDVLLITGDHSTPAYLGRHTQHAVPLALLSPQNPPFDEAEAFTERQCLRNGCFGRVRGVELMASLLSHAGKLKKYDL